MPTHFPPAALKFLKGLARHNDREWFEARRTVYEESVRAPMLALIDEINHSMEDFAPEYIRPAHKTIMRIYRDTRFSKDKRPYKRHIAAWWARVGSEKTSGGFYLHIHPDEVLIWCGVFVPEREQLLAIRRFLSEHADEYRSILSSITRTRRLGMTGLTGEEAALLTRMPKGFAKDDPADELLRARNWGVRASLPAALAEQPGLAREIIQRFRLAAPLVALLNEPIVRAERRDRVMF